MWSNDRDAEGLFDTVGVVTTGLLSEMDPLGAQIVGSSWRML